MPRLIETLKELHGDEAVRRAEFRDRVRADEKHEFINGDIVVHGPARYGHNRVVVNLVTLLQLWSARHVPGASVVAEKSLIDCGRNDYEPDVSWYGPAKAAAIAVHDVILPPHDLAVEVLSPSTEWRDRGVKFTDYAASGVGEYWIIDAEAFTVERHRPGADGESYGVAETGEVIEFGAGPGGFPPLRFPVRALFDDAAFAEALVTLAG